MTTSPDMENLVQQVQLLERAAKALSGKQDPVANFSLSVICTSAAQALGMAFQASALNMQGSFMTQQAANVRAVLETYRQLECGRPGSNETEPVKKKGHAGRHPSDTTAALEALIDAVTHAEPEDRHRL